jgi:hypothetical protein
MAADLGSGCDKFSGRRGKKENLAILNTCVKAKNRVKYKANIGEEDSDDTA